MSRQNSFALPVTVLTPDQFLPFLRQVEMLSIEQKLSPILVYWSRQAAARLLPAGSRFRGLMREAKVSIFSDDRLDPPDEWCFLLESSGLCITVYGQQNGVDGETYQCTGTMDPVLVNEAFFRLKPKWSALDSFEYSQLEEIRSLTGFRENLSTTCTNAEVLLRQWPMSFCPRLD